MYVTVTQLQLKSILKFPMFMRHTARVSKQIKSSQGLVKQKTIAKNPYVFLTLTAWDSKDDMMRFRNSGAHLEAMKQINKMAKKTKAAYWESDEFPTWKYAFEKIKEKWEHANLHI